VSSAAPQDHFGLVGTVLERQFRVDKVVGEGGFGVVYKGWHLTLEQPVAIKALKMPDAHDSKTQATLLAKFREEAKISYVLSQQSLNIVRTIDFGATATPTGAWAPFAVLEWLEGETLAQELARRRAAGMRGRTLQETLRVLEPAAKALSVAHQRRVAHRDIKPGNFFLLPDAAGVPLKLLDFGIAKVMSDDPKAGKTTRSQMLSFTPQYAAPEQIDSRYGLTGPWTDVYALGLVLTEMLTDRPPFDVSQVAEVLLQIVDPARRPTPRARGAIVPDAVEAVCARALSVDARQRYPDAGAMWAALEAAAAFAMGSAPTPPPGSVAAVVVPSSAMPGAILTPHGPPMLGVPPSYVPSSYGPPSPHLYSAPPPARGSVTWIAIALGVGLALMFMAIGVAAILLSHR
jgi:eukaryotic-like serine/threonine-protein kinase